MQQEFSHELGGRQFWVRIYRVENRWGVAVSVGDSPETVDDTTYETAEDARSAGKDIGRGIILGE